MNKFKLSIFLIIWTSLLYSQNLPIDSLIYQFKHVKNICDEDDGKLWGVNLYSPILVIERDSKDIVANERDNQGLFIKNKSVYTGNFDTSRVVSYSAIDFAGKSWVMMAYPFYFKDSFELYSTYIHESFHRLQGDLGFNFSGYNNDHMDKMEARILLKLEWESLIEAIKTTNNERDIALFDALQFRKLRRLQFPGVDTNENRFELHEGLAEYTAFKLCTSSKSEFENKLLERKFFFTNMDDSYVRTFGYYSGLLYGFLLDETGVSWRTTLTSESDLGKLLQNLYEIENLNDTTGLWQRSRTQYNYENIMVHEKNVQNKKDRIKQEYILKFTQDPVLIIPLDNARLNIGNNLQPMDSLGTLFPYVEIYDKWGFLKVNSGGCLITFIDDGQIARISAMDININANLVTGEDWKLKINGNWIINKRGRNYYVEQLNNTP